MVNTALFQTVRGALLPAAKATNAEGAPAYAFTARHELAQLAATGCLTRTFYADAQDQLERVMALAQEVDATFVAKTAAIPWCICARPASPCPCMASTQPCQNDPYPIWSGNPCSVARARKASVCASTSGTSRRR